VTLVARWRKHFWGVLADFLVAERPPKEVVKYRSIHSLLFNGVITASSHTNRDKSCNCDIDVTYVDVRCFFQIVVELNEYFAICIS